MFTAHFARLFMSFRSKIWPCRSLRRPRFSITGVYFHYWMTFAAYRLFGVFVHNFHLTLWPWPLSFWPWRCLMN